MNNKIKFTLSLLTLLTLSACQQTTISTASQVALPATFTHNGSAQVDLSRWWQAWGDAQLSTLISRAMTQNLDYRIALSRLNEAKAASDYAEADKGVQVAANVDGGVARRDLDTMLGNSRGSNGNLYGGV